MNKVWLFEIEKLLEAHFLFTPKDAELLLKPLTILIYVAKSKTGKGGIMPVLRNRWGAGS